MYIAVDMGVSTDQSYRPVLLWSRPVVQYSAAVDASAVTSVKFGQPVCAYSDCHRMHVIPIVILLDHVVGISTVKPS